MPIPLITTKNLSEGLHIPFVYVNEITSGLFINMLLFVIWTAITFGLFFNQKRQLGIGDFPMSLAIGGFVTGVVTILLSLVDGMVNPYTYVIVLVVAMLSVLFFLFDRKEAY